VYGRRETPVDSVRESLYNEVAALISQNEHCPQYLLELFRELQVCAFYHSHLICVCLWAELSPVVMVQFGCTGAACS
jgi:hypothetical protein